MCRGLPRVLAGESGSICASVSGGEKRHVSSFHPDRAHLLGEPGTDPHSLGTNQRASAHFTPLQVNRMDANVLGQA